MSSYVRTISANERRCYLCNVFFHWLNTFLRGMGHEREKANWEQPKGMPQWRNQSWASWHHLVTQMWVNTGSGNGLLPDGTTPVPGTILTYHHWSTLAFSRGNFTETVLDITYYKMFEIYVFENWKEVHLPGANEFDIFFVVGLNIHLRKLHKFLLTFTNTDKL